MSKIELLKQLQSDSLVFIMKIHNYHWNVKGGDFFQVHKLTQSIYEQFNGIFDELAERIKQLGGMPAVTLSEVLKTSKVREDDGTKFSGTQVLSNILNDYKHFLESFRKLSQLSNDDSTTQSYADEQVAYLEKAIWMLESQL